MGSLCSTRNTSFSSSVSASSSRTRLAPSRQTSNSSYASSVGPGTRPKSSHGRPQTSMAFNKSTTKKPNAALTRPRPTTSMSQRHVEEESSHSRQDGMPQAPSFQSSVHFKRPSSAVFNPKLRPAKSMHCMRSPSPVENRDVSLSTAMSNLHIEENATSNHIHQTQVIVSMCKPKSIMSLCRESARSERLQNIDDFDGRAMILFQPLHDGLVAPKTPSHIPVLSKSDAVVATPATPSKTPRCSKKSEITPFLTKESNIPSFTAWDVRDRLESIESMYTDLKNNLNSTSLERSGLEEAVALYKARSKQ